MNSSSCEQARGQIALAAIGRLPESERLSLDSHLEGCPDCRNELADLSGLEPALSAAELDRVDQVVAVPDSLRTAVLGSLDAEVATEVARNRRTSRLRTLSIAAALVILAGGGTAIAIGITGSNQPAPAKTFALTGPGGATATVQLTSESWGTSVHLRASGQTALKDLTVWMREYNGSWWTAGTYNSLAGSVVNVTMSCSVPPAEIDGVRVTNAAGQEVLGTYDD
jgi:anti-sigma factor RsiW